MLPELTLNMLSWDEPRRVPVKEGEQRGVRPARARKGGDSRAAGDRKEFASRVFKFEGVLTDSGGQLVGVVTARSQRAGGALSEAFGDRTDAAVEIGVRSS